LLNVPMIREKELIGAIGIYRQEVRPFTDKQIELVKNFAAQAVIAIENARLLNELRQSLEQQTATADILRVISSSPGELEPVFQAMLENAVRTCEANLGMLFIAEGKNYRMAAGHNLPSAFVEERQREPLVSMSGNTALARVAKTKTPVQIPDVAEDPAYRSDPQRRSFISQTGARTVVCVPMLKEDELVGAVAIYRQEVRPFADKQIALVTNFAAQAVIAIENARLLNELRQRTLDLSVSLEQQTATAEVLRVISSSPGDLTPVFNAMLENATKLCGAEFGVLYLDVGDLTRIAAAHNVPPALAATQNVPLRVHSKSGHAEVRRTKQVVHVDDIRAMPPYLEGDPRLVALADLGGARTTVGVPILKGDALLGTLAIYRKEVRPFTAKQIELASNFAAQAVIAIENARLLNELRQRTSDLTESLEQQTATSKVLEVISRSAFDLQAVFETVAESSVRLCGADRAFVYRFDGELLRMAVAFNAPEKLKDFVSKNPIHPGRQSASARAELERRTIHIPDARADPEYTYGTLEEFRTIGTLEELRTILAVPILKGDNLRADWLFIIWKRLGRSRTSKLLWLRHLPIKRPLRLTMSD